MAGGGSFASYARVTWPMLPPENDTAPQLHRIELSLAPDDLRPLLRMDGLHRAGRTAAVRTLWHDTADGALAASGRSLAETGPSWRLEALRPATGHPWPPLAPTPLLAEGRSAAALGIDDPITPVAALQGRRSRFTLPGLALTLLDAELRGVAATERTCRLWLEGDRRALTQAASALAESLRVTVPCAGLAAQAVSVARGQEPPARHTGATVISPGRDLSSSIAAIIGQLLDVMLHWAGPAASGQTATPVHQMRVAIRRLRSALSIFRPVIACAEIEALNPALKDLAARLGAARDWDVFLAGTAAAMTETLPPDPRIKALLAASRRKRDTAYAGLRIALAAPQFRVLQVQLGCAATLRPWEHPEFATGETATYATAVLTRRWKRVRRAGRDLKNLPIPALHELRKDCKRLRYAAEFFQPLFASKATRQFLKHLAALQEELGLLNDGAVAAALMAHLGRGERGYAAGLVQGFVAGSSRLSRDRIMTSWMHLHQQHPFWL